MPEFLRVREMSTMERPFLVYSLLVCCAVSSYTQAADVILNEYNAVSGSGFLNGGTATVDDDLAQAADSFFGRIAGNGGDWFELVVITDHLDMRQWKLEIWEGGVYDETLNLTDNSIWSDLRSGTIITVAEDVPDDISYDPKNGDWWINVQANDTASGAYIEASNFKVSNSNWQLTIKDQGDNVKFGPAGEGVSPASGVGDTEVFKLKAKPSDSITPASTDYDDDGNLSTFGSHNVWGTQNFSALRSFTAAPGVSAVILNEYSAVLSDKFLNSGGATSDRDGGRASDAYFGRVAGNGGDWFELVVITDHLDMRSWQLDIWENGQHDKTLTLTDETIWSDLRSGTIITVSEDLPDDISYNPLNGDWWINVQANDTASGDYIEAANFKVTTDDWQLIIKNSSGVVIFGPAGEGIYPTGGVNDDEIFRLEEDPSASITGTSIDYEDAESLSTFGSPNIWNEQSFKRLRYNLADFNESGAVDLNDFAILSAAWLSTDNDSNWNSECDISAATDNVINKLDLRTFTQNWLVD